MIIMSLISTMTSLIPMRIIDNLDKARSTYITSIVTSLSAVFFNVYEDATTSLEVMFLLFLKLVR